MLLMTEHYAWEQPLVNMVRQGTQLQTKRVGVVGGLLLEPTDANYGTGFGGFSEHLLASDHEAMVVVGVNDEASGWAEMYEVRRVVPKCIPVEAAVMLCTWCEVYAGTTSATYHFNLLVHQWPTRAGESAAQERLWAWIDQQRLDYREFLSAEFPVAAIDRASNCSPPTRPARFFSGISRDRELAPWRRRCSDYQTNCPGGLDSRSKTTEPLRIHQPSHWSLTVRCVLQLASKLTPVVLFWATIDTR